MWIESLDKTECDGRLTIRLSKGRRAGGVVEVDEYAVQETPLLFAMGRAFLLLNLTDDAQRDVYETQIYANGGAACTCIAGNVKRYVCKHIESTRALLAEGCFPDRPVRSEPCPAR